MDVDRFSHQVAFYEDEQAFLAVTMPFVEQGLESGEPVLVAVGKGKIGLLESELGDTAEGVRFADMAELGLNPARIIPAWREFLELNLQPGGGVRGIGEPIWPGRSAPELDECQRHEGLLNVAFAGGPAWSLLCPYDSRALDDAVLELAFERHRGAERFAPLAGKMPTPPAGSRGLAFGRDQLSAARALVAGEASGAGMSEGRTADVVAAAGELAANSVLHGGGTGTLRVWREADTLLVEVEDSGLIADPLVGRVRPTSAQARGRGLWMANQLCDLVRIRSGEQGTAVRLQMGLN